MRKSELSTSNLIDVQIEQKKKSEMNFKLPTAALNELKEFYNSDICTYPSFTAFLLASMQKEMRFLQLQHNVDELGRKITKLAANQKQYLVKRYLSELINEVQKNE